MKKILPLFLLLAHTFSFAQLTQFEEEYLKTFDPQGLSYYNFKEGISNQGKQIASSLTDKLANFQNLISTQNPDELLADFNSKMQNIQNLEQNYLKNANQFAFNTGKQIGNSVNNKDAMGVLSGIVGFAEARSEQKAAEKKLAAQKRALQLQQKQKMSQLYYKALTFNTDKKKEYLMRAAYAENLLDEKYNLEFVKNLNCFEKSMKTSFNTYSTNWLKNNCAQPKEPVISQIENKFVAKNIQLRKIAERKYKYFKENGDDEFEEAAISYAAAAANKKASAANFFLLGKYYTDENPILALSTLLTVKELDPNYKKTELEALIKENRDDASFDIKNALNKNNTPYLNAFLEAGLDKQIKIEGRSILSEAIAIDNPDAVQTILNKYIADLPQEEINQKTQKTIMLCALKNSHKTITRFAKLGVPVDFKINNFHPIDIAVKAEASDAFEVLMELTNQREAFENKYKNSSTSFLALASENPTEAALKIDGLKSGEEQRKIALELFKDLDNQAYFKTILNSESLKKMILADDALYLKIKKRFASEVQKPSPKSNAALLYGSGLISFENLPTLDEITPIEKKGKPVKINFYKDLAIDFSLKNQIKKLDEVRTTLGDEKYNELANNLEREFIQLKDKELDLASKRYLLNLIYKDLVEGTYNSTDAKLRNAFVDELNSIYEVKTITNKEKIKTILAGLEEVLKTAKDQAQLTQAKVSLTAFKELNKKLPGNLSKAEQNVLSSVYMDVAITKGWDLDEKMVASLKGMDLKDGSSNENIAFIAFSAKNLDLYKALDKDFDLAPIKNKAGQTIPELLLSASSSFSGILEVNNEEIFSYWSTDFNKINEKEMLLKLKEIYLNNPTFLLKPDNQKKKYIKFVEQVTHFKINPNGVVTEDGGTILHEVAEELINDLTDGRFRYGNGRFLSLDKLLALAPLKMDTSIKNKEGKTAFDLFERKAKKTQSKLEKGLKSFKKKNNLLFDPAIRAKEITATILATLK